MVTQNSSNNKTGASGTVLQGQGVGTASDFSTATYPSTATGTGKILRADGTNWVATTATFPDTAGTSGNVLTSNGTNWSSSAAPAGPFIFVATQSASTSASISFTGLGTYPTLLVIFRSVWAATATANLTMVVSSDNGSNYANSGYQASVNYSAYNLTTLVNINSTSVYPLSGPCAANTNVSGQIFITGTGTGDVNVVNGQVCYPDSTLAVRAFGTIGGSNTTTGVNAIRFLMSSGNLTIGTFDVYGLRES